MPVFATLYAVWSGRSFAWPVFRKRYLADRCSACDTKNDLELHHIIPYAVDKSLELEPTNVVTLCPKCHLIFGHFGNWQLYNPNVIMDIIEYQMKPRARIKDGGLNVV